MKSILKSLPICGCILYALCACSEQEPTAEELQFAELVSTFNELKQEEWMEVELQQVAEAEDLLKHYDTHHDATYATPNTKLTMLHLACMFKKTKLVQHLLENGADPNAFTIDQYGEIADTPLRFAISPGFLKDDTDERNLRLVELLIKAGADTTGIISHGENLWSTAATVCESEALARKLQPYAPPAKTDDFIRIIERGWADLMQELLQKQELLPHEAQTLLVYTAFPLKNKSAKEHRRLAELLLQRGADINGTCRQSHDTVLRLAAFQLGMLEDKELREDWLDFIAFLINAGANPTSETDLRNTGTYAYDFLAGRDGVLESLAARGCHINAPTLEIRPGAYLCNDIIRAHMCRIPTEEILKHFDTIASIFAPSKELMRDEMFSSALAAAAKLLSRVDTSRTAEVISHSPLWQKKLTLSNPIYEEATVADLIHALDEAKDIPAPPDALVQVAEQAIALKDFELAATAVQLLGHSPNADAHINKLLDSPLIAIRAGAWNAKLHRAGLPLATVGSGAYWLQQHNRKADSPVLQTILLATSLEEMWNNTMTPERKRQFIEALQTIGAPHEAIRVYGEFADNMNNPEKLDELSAMGDDWQYELEIATAKYIFAHAEEILSPAPQK